MDSRELLLVAIFLAIAAFLAPLARRFKLGLILGYLIGGIMLRQFEQTLGIYNPEGILHIAEFGIALFLFLIGLELKPKRLWSFRQSVFGAGSTQVLLTALTLTSIGVYFGYALSSWLLVGLAVALSSTPFALQILAERGELQAKHGRLAFSILLFQDIAAIPIIAMVPIFASGVKLEGTSQDIILTALKVFGAIAALIILGRYALDKLYRLVAATGVREAMTASALLTVLAAVMLMQSIGFSPALGAFIAGVLLAESEYRHQLASDIEPFQALLLGLFFTAIGMTLDASVLFQEPVLIAIGVIGLISIKMLVLYGIGIWQGLDNWSARRLALVLSQGGEFAFVVFAAAGQSRVLTPSDANILSVVVTLSMLCTPLLIWMHDMFDRQTPEKAGDFDEMPKNEGHVVIAGFGRFGQIPARILRAKQIPFTALDLDAEQVNFVGQFGNKIYYGDASRLSILEAADLANARAFVLAIDDIEASLTTAQTVKRYFPHVPIYARARNRQHAYRLMDIGVEHIEREVYLGSLQMTKVLLKGLGIKETHADYIVKTFREHDEKRLFEDYKHYTDMEKIRVQALKTSEELERLFAQDLEGIPDIPDEPPKAKGAKADAKPASPAAVKADAPAKPKSETQPAV